MKNKKMMICIVIFTVMSLTIGYSAFGTEMSISNIASEIRFELNTRITAFIYSSSTNDGLSSYEEYDKDELLTNVSLPNEDSTITYKVTVTNFGNVETGLYSINNLPSNLTYSITGDYKLREKICGDSESCTLGATETFYITIGYASGGYNSESIEYALNLNAEFRQFYTVTYSEQITNNGYPVDIMAGDDLSITFTDPVPEKINLYLDGVKVDSSLYSYENNVLTYNNVTGNILIKLPEKLYNIMKMATNGVDSNIDFSKAASSTNGEGVNTVSGTENDEFPIYYYRGNITNNNVRFANFCWKMVRTTETGGVKLIYNGVPAEDGSCDNTGTASQLSDKVNFNSNTISPSNVGYMQGVSYAAKGEEYSMFLLSNYTVSATASYYYGNSVVYENGKYTLQNAETKVWSENYTDLVGYYTCRTSDVSCYTVYYIAATGTTTSQPVVSLSGGKKIDDLNIVLSKEFTTNDDGSYTLSSPETITRGTWFTDYANYNNYYVCEDLTSTTCGKVLNIVSPSNIKLNYKGGIGYVYGNDVSWDGEKYTLIDTYTSSDWYSDKNNIQIKYHYTCRNTGVECTEVYYTHYLGDQFSLYYLTLTNGKNIETAKNEMFTNTTDSIVKGVIDSWYEANMTSYTLKLEDTVWCNDRSIVAGTLMSKDASGSTSNTIFGSNNRNDVTMQPSVKCQDQNDAFTLKVDFGGTEGYGNNALKYPVALLTADEASMAGNGSKGYSNSTFLYTGEDWWTLSPSVFTHVNSSIYSIKTNLTTGFMYNSYGVRPAISLASGTAISDGSGTVGNPYVIE